MSAVIGGARRLFHCSGTKINERTASQNAQMLHNKIISLVRKVNWKRWKAKFAREKNFIGETVQPKIGARRLNIINCAVWKPRAKKNFKVNVILFNAKSSREIGQSACSGTLYSFAIKSTPNKGELSVRIPKNINKEKQKNRIICRIDRASLIFSRHF